MLGVCTNELKQLALELKSNKTGEIFNHLWERNETQIDFGHIFILFIDLGFWVPLVVLFCVQLKNMFSNKTTNERFTGRNQS